MIEARENRTNRLNIESRPRHQKGGTFSHGSIPFIPRPGVEPDAIRIVRVNPNNPRVIYRGFHGEEEISLDEVLTGRIK